MKENLNFIRVNGMNTYIGFTLAWSLYTLLLHHEASDETETKQEPRTQRVTVDK